MRASEITDADSKAGELKSDESSVIPGVPDAIALPFLRGLDDVEHGRVVDGDAVIAESRALLSRYRQNKRAPGLCRGAGLAAPSIDGRRPNTADKARTFRSW